MSLRRALPAGIRVPYRSCHDAAAAVRILTELAPRAAIVDIEPLIAVWNTRMDVLDAGIAAFLTSVAEYSGGPRRIIFSTNAARRPSGLPAVPGMRVRYVSHAGKPFRTGPYRGVEGLGAVVGDQIATDGVLAWRLGLVFVHYIPDDRHTPIGARLMRALGRPLHRVLFDRDSP